MFRLVFALLCATLARAQAVECPDCGAESRRTTLCSAHAELEALTLREQRAAFRSPDAAARVRALEAVAALTRAHTNLPTPAVAKFLGDALKDESLEVRFAGVRLLVDGQHRGEAVRGILRGLEEAQRTWRKVEQRLVEGEAAPDAGRANVAVTVDELTSVPDYVETVLSALSHVQDERALQALLSYLRSPLESTPGRFLVAASEATLAFDTRKGTEAVINLLEQIELGLAQGSIPRRFAGAEGGSSLLDMLKAPLENAGNDDYTAIVTELYEYAASKRLAAPADAAQAKSLGWKAWLASVQAALPETVAAER